MSAARLTMGVVQEAYSRRGIYEGDSGSEDEAEALFREVAALEEQLARGEAIG